MTENREKITDVFPRAPDSNLLYDHHIFPFEFSDPHDPKTIFASQPIHFKLKDGGTIYISYLADTEDLRAIAVTFPREIANHPDRGALISHALERSLASIRVSGFQHLSLIPQRESIFSYLYQSNDLVPKHQGICGVNRPLINQSRIDKICGVFVAIPDEASTVVISLMADTQIALIPIQYRVLSAIRAIELLWPKTSERNAVYRRFDRHYQRITGTDMNLQSAIPQIRTRCAHGKSRGRINPTPFYGVSIAQTELTNIVCLLRSIVAYGVIEQYGMQIVGITYHPSPAI